MKVAIQGERGSFSHEAAERMVPRCTVVSCARSAEVFDRVERGSVAAAVIPIENTLAGTVAEHADLLVSRDVFIQGEYLLRIVHNRDRRTGCAVEVRCVDVLSHPVALDQCRDFFQRHPQIRARAVLRHGGQREARCRKQVEGCGGNRGPAGRSRIFGKYS